MTEAKWNNIENYLRFRGDISFADSPFNEVDNLILSAFCYADLTGLASEEEYEEGLTIAEFAKRLKQKGRYTKKEDILTKPSFVYLLGSTKRFGDLPVSHFVDDVSLEETIQFSAMEIALKDGTAYVAYRGTDDSAAGWKEDFTLTFLEVPGQRKALDYLRSALTRYHSVMVGGHSKGGNLALYAVSFLSEEEASRVSKVYLNDSPGLCGKVKKKAVHNGIEKRIVRIQPHFSVVGELLEPGADTVRIVTSYGKDIVEHDPFTWEVDGTSFVTVKSIDPDAKSLAQALSFWLEALDDEEKKKTIDDMFASIHKYPSISAWREKGLREILKAFRKFVRKNSDINSLAYLPVAALGDGKTRSFAKATLDFLFKNTLPIGLGLLAFGIIFLFFPKISLSVLAFTLIGLTASFEIFMTIYLTAQNHGDIEPQLFRMYVSAILLLILLAMIMNPSILEVYQGFIFGIMLVMLGFREVGEIFKFKPRPFFLAAKAFLATYLVFTGGFLLIDTNHQLFITSLLLGSVSIVFGLWYTGQGLWTLVIEKRAREALKRIR